MPSGCRPSRNTAGNDIALVRLPTLARTIDQDPLELALPVCLPWQSEVRYKMINVDPNSDPRMVILNHRSRAPTEEVLVMGWGQTSNNPSIDAENLSLYGVHSTTLLRLRKN